MPNIDYQNLTVGQLQYLAGKNDPTALRILQSVSGGNSIDIGQAVNSAVSLAKDPSGTMKRWGQAILNPSQQTPAAPKIEAQATPQTNAQVQNMGVSSAPNASASIPIPDASQSTGGGGSPYMDAAEMNGGGSPLSSMGGGGGEGGGMSPKEALGSDLISSNDIQEGANIGGIGFKWGGSHQSQNKAYQQAVIDKQQEEAKQEQIKTNLADPANTMTEGANKGMMVLAHMGPFSRIPAVANWMLKTAGEKPLTKGEAMLNLVRPPIPMYNYANADKAQNEALNHARAVNVMTNIGLGVGALNALGNMAK